MDAKLAAVVAQTKQCATYSAAWGKVNDFCEEGQSLFFEYIKDKSPFDLMGACLPKDQHQGEGN